MQSKAHFIYIQINGLAVVIKGKPRLFAESISKKEKTFTLAPYTNGQTQTVQKDRSTTCTFDLYQLGAQRGCQLKAKAWVG